MSALGRGYRAMTAEVGAGTARLTVFLAVLFMFALLFGIACLAGVRPTDTLLETEQARRAFEAIKRHAGPRMLVRNLVVKPDELTVWAMDPDMSPWRTTPGTRQHSAHTYYVSGVFEQSWRVRHWKVFWSEWYWVSGPEPEGRDRTGSRSRFRSAAGRHSGRRHWQKRRHAPSSAMPRQNSPK